MDDSMKKKAEVEYRELASLYADKEIERMKEMDKKGLVVGLDGQDHCKDLKEWFNEELGKIRIKYGITHNTN